MAIACAFVYGEEEAFVYIKNAYNKLENPPQSLIFTYISIGSHPHSFLTKKEISDLTEYAVSKGITWESAQRMAFLTAENQKNTSIGNKKP